MLPLLAAAAMALALGPRRSWSGGISVALGFWAGHWVIAGWPPLPPVDVTRWLPYLAILGVVVAVAEGSRHLKGRGRWVLRGLSTVVAVWLLVAPLFRGRWDLPGGALWCGALVLALLFAWREHEQLGDRAGETQSAAVSILVAAGSALALALSHSALLGQLAGALAAALTGVLLASRWRGPAPATGSRPVVLVLLAGLWICGHYYASLPSWSAGLLALAPTATRIADVGPLGRLEGWKRAALRLAAASAALLLAVSPLAIKAASEASEYSY